MSVSVPSLSTPQAAFSDRRKAFRSLHERGCFVIPNPWDVGSARYLQHLGFPALATTSAGFAFSQGLPDSGDEAVIGRDRSLGYISSITAAVDLPVSADFMSGYDWRRKTWRTASLGARDWRCGPIDRGRHWWFFVTSLRPGERGRTRPCRATGDRSIGRGGAADGKSRVLSRGPSRSLPRERPTTAGVRSCRCRRALRPGSRDA